ncbi:hypothetical protein BHE74_00007216 [Ensete ventricosum]|nr:hypothetical protein GW17_00046901 [Ensete ventricosum]RWW84186.1 hypothetical protein BHE74_00007216 [Ensete ventricosum]RZR98971.1 hypothetical protein BHM03_00028434 [Ensete ventricosum]
MDACDTGLALGLGIGGRSGPSSANSRRLQEACLPLRSSIPQKQPSLTLSLSDDVGGSATLLKAEANKPSEEGRQARPSSPHSTVSSFSAAYTPTIKKEKDVTEADEEAEVERIDSRGGTCDDDIDGSARKKLRLTKEQSALLEDRTKLKQTEVDCEFLKRCCESLTDENRRLQKELQELKALKFAPSVYMQFPAAGLTMCPSCKTIGAAADVGPKGGSAESFVVAPPKPHFFNPFIHSAKC